MIGGKILKTGRKIRGLTQTEVAEIYGVNLKTYKRWESGLSAVAFDDVNTVCDHVFKLSLADVQRMVANG